MDYHNFDLDPILALHRTDHGFITFHRKVRRMGQEPVWRDCACIELPRLRQLFPAIAEDLEEDSFFCINTMWRPGSRPREIETAKWEPVPGEPLERRRIVRFPECQMPDQPKGVYWPDRRNENVTSLNACYVDLDCYKKGIPVGTLLAQLCELEVQGILPQRSMTVTSGRGVWLFWRLRDIQEEGRGQHAPLWQRELFTGVNRGIQAALECYGADPQATDPARTARVPGSIHTATGTRVRYELNRREDGNLPTYTPPMV